MPDFPRRTLSSRALGRCSVTHNRLQRRLCVNKDAASESAAPASKLICRPTVPRHSHFTHPSFVTGTDRCCPSDVVPSWQTQCIHRYHGRGTRAGVCTFQPGRPSEVYCCNRPRQDVLRWRRLGGWVPRKRRRDGARASGWVCQPRLRAVRTRADFATAAGA